MRSFNTMQYLDECWAACLGCSVDQLRDDRRHVVVTPNDTGSVKRPYPMRPDSISLVSYGEGWTLSVPGYLLEKAKKFCLGLSFSEIVREGDRLGHKWWRSGAEKRTELDNARRMGYEVMTRLADGINIRGWSHYFHWYCDRESWDDKPIDNHVRHLRKNDPDTPEEVWRQWLNTSWAIGGPGAKYEIADAFGYVLDGQLVSVSQVFANHDDFAWEIGANTLPEFRCRGFATEACRASTAFILKHGRIAWYYYNHYNRPSAPIPQKLPYFFYAEGLFSHNV